VKKKIRTRDEYACKTCEQVSMNGNPKSDGLFGLATQGPQQHFDQAWRLSQKGDAFEAHWDAFLLQG